MNHITQKNRLEKQLKLYKDFMPHCNEDDVVKLMHEIFKLINRIDKIREMEINEMVETVVFHYETRQSKMNFLNS